MTEVLNNVGIDLVTFGNHEFDISFSDLQQRINESKYDWINSNVHLAQNGVHQPFTKTQNGQRRSYRPVSSAPLHFPTDRPYA